MTFIIQNDIVCAEFDTRRSLAELTLLLNIGCVRRSMSPNAPPESQLAGVLFGQGWGQRGVQGWHRVEGK